MIIHTTNTIEGMKIVKNSGLKKENLVILSNNLTLDLSEQCKRSEYQPTDRFERFVEKIEEANRA